MANVISVAGAVGRNQDRSRDRQPTVMEQVLQGLQIAQGVYGLKSQYDQNQRADEQLELSKKADVRAEDATKRAAEAQTRDIAAEDRKIKGILLPEEASKLSQAFIMSKAKPKESANSVALTIQGDTEPTWFTPRREGQPRRTRMAENIILPGEETPVNALIDEDTGRVIQKYARGASELSPAALEAKQRSFNSAMEKYSEKTEPLNKTFNSIGSVEKELGFKLEDYDPKTDTVVRSGPNGEKAEPLPDLPGVSLPVVGRVNFYNRDARTMYATMQKVFNVELKDRSGAAVSNREMENLKTEFENGKFNTEPEMLDALKRYKAAASDLLNSMEAPYRSITDVEGKTVVDRLDQNGGFTSRRFEREMKQQQTAQQPKYSPEDQAKAQEILRQRGRIP